MRIKDLLSAGKDRAGRTYVFLDVPKIPDFIRSHITIPTDYDEAAVARIIEVLADVIADLDDHVDACTETGCVKCRRHNFCWTLQLALGLIGMRARIETEDRREARIKDAASGLEADLRALIVEEDQE